MAAGKLDATTFGGIALAMAGIFGGQWLEGGNPASLVQLAGFCIVFFGTVGAVLIQTRPSTFFQGLKLGWWAVVTPTLDSARLINDVTRWADVTRKQGVLKLEGEIRPSTDAFAKRGLELLIDGASPDELRDIMGIEITTYEERLRQAGRIWDAAGGYAPTIGILGAVLGLIQVMQNLTDPSKLGAGIAVAFVATIYGVALANLVFLPVANKIRAQIADRVRLQEMLIEGLSAIATGEHPRLITRRMQGYVG